ncbi:MAG: phosphoribosylformylglycinamidine synthase subunit PurQ [Rickettsiales bacterium]|nr:phosphoribosylformylglycinamidine synthase subunit PurQ [Rickettsiales bacterium]
MKAGVLVFPGSNCDRDLVVALKASGFKVEMIWHKQNELPKLDLVCVPGGFSYGDYLRCGAISAHSNIMKEVKKFADNGGYVLGICNGFQILTEAGLLPGVLMRNKNLKFICKEVYLRPENNDAVFIRKYKPEKPLKISIAHHDGNYFVTDDELKALNDNNQIAFKYCNVSGDVSDASNPNGSVANIAGVYNKNKNVLGLMPHPERHCDAYTGGIDGKIIFQSILG